MKCRVPLGRSESFPGEKHRDGPTPEQPVLFPWFPAGIMSKLTGCIRAEGMAMVSGSQPDKDQAFVLHHMPVLLVPLDYNGKTTSLDFRFFSILLPDPLAF